MRDRLAVLFIRQPSQGDIALRVVAEGLLLRQHTTQGSLRELPAGGGVIAQGLLFTRLGTAPP